MTILLLALCAVLAGLLVAAVALWLDAVRGWTADRERHEAERGLARAGLVAAHEDTRDALRLAAGWRAHAAELETFTVVLAPREPAGLYPADAVTNPGLRAVEGPGWRAVEEFARRAMEPLRAEITAGQERQHRALLGLYGEDAGPEDRCGPMTTPDCPGCAESGAAGCDLCCASAEPGGAA